MFLGVLMKAQDGLQRVLDVILTEIEEIKEQVAIVPEIVAEFEFRPLTEEEKKEFIESVDDRGRQILAELGGQKVEIAR